MSCACNTSNHCLVRGDTLSLLLKLNECNDQVTELQGDVTIDVKDPNSDSIIFSQTEVILDPVSSLKIDIPSTETSTWTLDNYKIKVTYVDTLGNVCTLTCIDLKIGEC